MLRLLGAGAAAGLSIYAGVAVAQTASPPVETPAPVAASAAPAAPPVDAFAQAIAARQVADFARREHDPYAMLTAARMLQQIPVTDSATPTTDAAFTPAGLFDEAKLMAKGDAQLLMQINIAQSTSSRGVLSSAFGRGLLRLVQEVGGKAAYRFNIKAKGGEPLRIGAIGDIGTALYIRLLDAAGKVVCLDDNADYAPVCAVTPRTAGNYRVDIVNKSAARSRTVILSN